MAPRLRAAAAGNNPNGDESPTTAANATETRPLVEPNSQESSDNAKEDEAASPHGHLYVDERQRDIHDIFNLVALIFVITSAAMDWDYGLLFQGLGSLAYTGEYFWWTWGLFVGYLLIDCLWVILIPECVKIPKMIVQHHIVVIIYMMAPIIFPEYKWFMGALLSVELNTWFLIARRFVYKKKITILSYPASLCFYASWIIIRCYFYPAILVQFIQLADIRIRETGKFWHWPMIFIPFHFALCCLNLKWSIDLFYPIIKSWVVRDGKNPFVL
eukprot:CAMPEP_0172462736 /NCGR_PEP_ID=MMETSP1065-20121228/44778_1 /TAXON_ID=265537 /ORGANISM="Amphiprora paludosa, Strain CCMP125" /LENGTH=271 /DNA_ID=CAMNT_0013218479 /DNA_START=107 /DNA_END=922 /DNA_ORIENTATION=+